jgi:hypothetical protein
MFDESIYKQARNAMESLICTRNNIKYRSMMRKLIKQNKDDCNNKYSDN